MNLLFSINRSYLPLLKTCLRSVEKNGGGECYHVYILHSDLTESDQQVLTSHFPMTFIFLTVDPSMFAGFPEFKRYPLQIYYRLASPLLLPEELDRILYLDVDTLVINSLEPLYTASFDGAYLMACTHTKKLLTKINQLRLGMENEAPYINSGVMLLNLKALRETVELERIRQFTLERKERLLLPDQDILTALYGDRVKLLDSLKYNLSDRTLALYNSEPGKEKLGLDWVRKNTVVVHFFGRNKPWKENYLGILGALYWEYAENGHT